MNRFPLILLAAIGLLLGAVPKQSRAQSAASGLQRLQTMKAANEKLLETQANALQKLDDLLKEAQQLRVFARRT